MLYEEQKDSISTDLNTVTLFVLILLCTLNLVIMLFFRKLEEELLSGTASTHLVK